jgi:hypothetical protein
MKTCCLVLFCSLLALSAGAQIGDRGQVYLGLNLIAGDTLGEGMFFAPSGIAIGGKRTYTGSTLDSDLFSANINILAECGFFLVDGFEVGPMLAFRFWDWHDNQNSSNYNREAVLAPGIQGMYIFRMSGIVHPYVQACGAFVWTRRKYDEEDYLGYKVMPVAGVKVEVGKAALDSSLFFSFVSQTLAGSSPAERTDTYSGGLRVGVSLYL